MFVLFYLIKLVSRLSQKFVIVARSTILNVTFSIWFKNAYLTGKLYLNASPQLRKQNRIKTITGTLAIEGNTLTEEQITAIIDGNGRMGRLWQTLILSKWHPLFLSLPLESVIKEHQQDYYHALEQANQQADSTPFIHFMLSVILQTLTQNASANASVKSPVDATAQIAGLKTPDAILRLLLRSPELTRPQMAEIIGKDIRTIGRAITKLQQAGQLTRVGSDKSGHWQVRE